MNLAVGAKTDVGRVREGNEDSFFADAPLFAVADGMGGHLAGDVASATAVEVIKGDGPTDEVDPEALADMVRAANQAIWDKARDDDNLRGMGTTCTLVYIDDSRAEIAHVGDSRLYLFRDGQLEQVTQDHTLVGRMVREGKLRPEEAERHPQRSIVTRALGVDENVEVDRFSLDLSEGDRLLICSDGLSSMLSSDDIAGALSSHSDPQAAADALVDLANAAGGEDNITVVVIDAGAEAGTTTVTAEHRSDLGERTNTDPAADTGYHQVVQAAPARKPRWRRSLVVTLLVLALVGVAGYAAARYALDNSWFVGVNETGTVTIYKGIPDDIGGLTLKEEHEATQVSLTSLPAFKRDEVQEGIKVESLDDAERTVEDLEQLAGDPEFSDPSDEQRSN